MPVVAPPAARWLTGRTREMTFTVGFTLPLEWAPLQDNRVHYVQQGSLLAAVDGAYRTSQIWSGPSGTRGPYVTISPEVQFTSAPLTFGPSPYPPDSARAYIWSPSGDPGGGWVEFTGWPLRRLQMGWRVVIYPGDGGSGGVSVFVPVGSDVVTWAPGAPLGSNPGGMGAVTYSSSGVPSGVTVPPSTLRAAPDDWERTTGTLYGEALTGTVTFRGGTLEEYFVNLDEPTTQDLSGKPLADHASELGQSALDLGLTPWARQYTERRQTGTTQSITVDLGGLGSWTVTTAANTVFPNSDFSVPFAQASTFCHSLGSGGATVNSTYVLDATWSAGGWSFGPISATLSNAGGSLSSSGGTATTVALTGSSAWPSFPNFLPGGGQVYRGGVKIGSGVTQVKLIPPEQRVFNGTLLRADGSSNTVAMSVEIGNAVATVNTAPTLIETLTGITNTFTRTYNYDDRAVRLATDAGNSNTNGNGSAAWYVAKPSSFPMNPCIRLIAPSGEEVSLRRMCMRGRRWPLWELAASSSVDVLSDPWPSYTAGGGLTVTTSGSILSLANANTTPTNVTFDAAAPMPEYRYHKVRFRSVGSAGRSLGINRVGGPGISGQILFSWSVPSGADGEWVEVDLDGLAGYSGLAHVLSPGAVTGNWALSVPGSTTIEVEWLRSSVRTFAKWDALHHRWDQVRGVVGIVDGWPYPLLGVDATNRGWAISKSATPSSSKPWGNASPINGNIGTTSYYPEAWWYDSDNTYCMAGGGLLYTGSGGSLWDIVVDEDPGTLYAQDVFERLLVYPGAGDVFQVAGGAYGLTTTAQYGIVLGALATGLLVGEADTTPDVVAYQSSVERARGVPATAENYARLAPVLKVGLSHNFRLDPEGDVAQTVSATGLDRSIIRTLWLLLEDGSDPLAVDTVRRRIVTAQGKRLACYHADNRALDVLSIEHPPTSWISLDIDPHTRQLWGLGRLGSELVLYGSQDFGDTIWEVLRVTGKSGVVIADPVRGVTATYYEDASGAVQQLLRSPDGTTAGPTAVKLSGVALTAKVLSGDTDEWAAGRHLLKVRQAGVLKIIAGQDLAGATFEPWIV